MSVTTNHIPNGIVWDRTIARILNAPLERLRKTTGDDRTYEQISADVDRLLSWLQGLKDPVEFFRIDLSVDTPTQPVLAVYGGRMVITRGFPLNYCNALTEKHSLNADLTNWFTGVLVAYITGHGQPSGMTAL